MKSFFDSVKAHADGVGFVFIGRIWRILWV